MHPPPLRCSAGAGATDLRHAEVVDERAHLRGRLAALTLGVVESVLHRLLLGVHARHHRRDLGALRLKVLLELLVRVALVTHLERERQTRGLSFIPDLATALFGSRSSNARRRSARG